MDCFSLFSAKKSPISGNSKLAKLFRKVHWKFFFLFSAQVFPKRRQKSLSSARYKNFNTEIFITLWVTYPVSAVEQLTAVELQQRCQQRELLGGQTSSKTQTELFAKCCRKWRTGCGTGFRPFHPPPPLVLRSGRTRSWTDWAHERPLGSWPWSWTWTPTTCLAWVPGARLRTALQLPRSQTLK